MPTTRTHKDAVQDASGDRKNVAQFVRFHPRRHQRYSMVHGHTANHRFTSSEAAIQALFVAIPERSLNARNFEPEDPKSREFLYGLEAIDSVIAALRRLADGSLFPIVNEAVDVHDGGASGVAYGDVIEVAPALSAFSPWGSVCHHVDLRVGHFIPSTLRRGRRRARSRVGRGSWRNLTSFE